MSIFKKIGQFFKGLFNAAEKAYSKLTPEQQAALQNGAGLIDIINKHLESTPKEVRDAINVKFPELDIMQLETAMFAIANAYGVTTLTNVDQAITRIQKHLLEKEGKDWAFWSHTGALAVALVFAPAATKMTILVQLLEYVYHKFFKKSI